MCAVSGRSGYADAVMASAPNDAHAVMATAHGVAFAYGKSEILTDICFELYRGEVLGITGPSGSGKSTLMALLGLFAARSGGELHVLGEAVAQPLSARQVTTLRRRMGWIPRLPLNVQGRTAIDNALIGLRPTGETHQELLTRVTGMFEALDLSHIQKRNVSVLSGVELQRLAIIRALARRPEIILADEPTASLDATNTALVGDALSFAAESSTIVIASHDPEILQYCKRVLRVSDGRIV